MKTISILKAIKGKPSIALQHMVDGLLKQSSRKGFIVTMRTYGELEKGICFGCAATCAVQNVTKTDFTKVDISRLMNRAKLTNTQYLELSNFEDSIDLARRGSLLGLFIFCGIESNHEYKFDKCFDLNTKDWKQQIPKVKSLISKLKKAGY